LNPGGPPDGGHADDLFGAEFYEAQLPTRKEFLPWHRPRKHFVRQHQWCEQIGRLLESLEGGDETIRYLGLPGDDLLDLRHFHAAICEPNQRRLRFLGFNSGARPSNSLQTEINISLDEVRKLPSVDPRSDVVWDDIAGVANENSIAWRMTREFGPYDVINLDLCDGFGASPPSGLTNTHYDAMARLMSLQSRRTKPWLLFLTTRVGAEHVNEQVMQKLVDKYSRNLDLCPEFRAASEERFAIGDRAALSAKLPEDLSSRLIFLIGLTKWLIGLAEGQQPRSKVELRSVIGYRVVSTDDHEDLISLALRIDPQDVPAADAMGLAQRPLPASTECQQAARAVARVASRVDADAVLLGNPELRQEMIDGTAQLLELARYDVNDYRTWVGTPE
jgi:hypothetical protein